MSEPKTTKQRILDAAEHLFARDGFHPTSLRAITTRAEVNLAAVNYHFGSKQALLEAVIERRLTPLNRIRHRRLEEARQAAAREDRRPAVREVLAAFIEPTLSFGKSGPAARDFIALIGRGLAEPDDTVRSVFLRFMGPLFLLLFDTFCLALPALPRHVLFSRLHFALGATAHAMLMLTKFPLEPPGVTQVCEAETLIAQLVPFIAAGMETPP